MRFREVKLPDGVPGGLYLHSMPGRYEPLADVWAESARLAVGTIVCLAPLDEIREKSPAYAKAIETDEVPCSIRRFPVCDYQGPDDDEAFKRLALDVADSLRRGDAVLVHCGEGIGRTGMFAIAALMALGLSTADARCSAKGAGSEPERRSQAEALRRLAQSLVPQEPIASETKTEVAEDVMMRKMLEVGVKISPAGEILIAQPNPPEEDQVVVVMPEQVDLLIQWLHDAKAEIAKGGGPAPEIY